MHSLIHSGSGLLVLPILIFGLAAACGSSTPPGAPGGPAAGGKPPARAREGLVPGRAWKAAEDPEDLGWNPRRLRRVLRRLDRMDTAAFMLVTGGRVVAREGRVRARFRMHSVRKSLLSALYGIFIHEGLIDPEATLGELGIDDIPPRLTREERGATVADLLASRSGVYHEAVYEVPSMEEKRPDRGSHPPGTHWYYNNWDFNVLGTILRQRVGLSIGEAFETRIAAPLEMEDFRRRDVYLVEGPESRHPAYPFRMSARDLARFGLLYLRGGRWKGRQILPAGWVQESTRARTITGRLGTKSGYGYMWWVTAPGGVLPDARLPVGSFTASGSGGQRLTVIPSMDTVVVHLMNTDRDGAPRVGTDDWNEFLEMLLAARAR